MINGRFFAIFVDDTTPRSAGRGANYRMVACATENSFSMSAEGISYPNKSDDGFDQSYTGRISTSFSMSGQAIGLTTNEKLTQVNFNDLALLMVNKREFWIKQYDPIEETIVRETWCRIGSYDEQAPLEGVYTFNAQFVGIGKPVTLSANLYRLLIATDTTGNVIVQNGEDQLLTT